MESVHHEQQLVLPVVKTVRDRIVAFMTGICRFHPWLRMLPARLNMSHRG